MGRYERFHGIAHGAPLDDGCLLAGCGFYHRERERATVQRLDRIWRQPQRPWEYLHDAARSRKQRPRGRLHELGLHGRAWALRQWAMVERPTRCPTFFNAP